MQLFSLTEDPNQFQSSPLKSLAGHLSPLGHSLPTLALRGCEGGGGPARDPGVVVVWRTVHEEVRGQPEL